VTVAESKLSQNFVAEIIGPAGAGKTSLSHLLRGSADIRAGLSVWRLSPALLALSIFSSLPNVVALCRSSKRVGWDDVKLVIQLNALRRLLHRESSKGYQTLLLDEGTVFALAKLYSFGPGHTTPDDSDLWMQDLFNNLAPLLDAVIWLDAPDSVLARRIRQRDKPHRLKHGSDAEIREHLAGYRESFEWVVSELSRRNALKVFRFSTDQEPLEEIAAQVLAQARVRV
jgi:hypothetical protein